MQATIWKTRPNVESTDDFRHNSNVRLYYRKYSKNPIGLKGVLDNSKRGFGERRKELKNMIPIQVNERGQIVCIPMSNDEPTIGIIGQRRMGKTLMFENILGHAVWNCNVRCGIISDQTGESGSWGKANVTPNFLKKTLRFYQNGVGIPIVQLYPNIEGGNMPKVKNAPIIKISYSFVDFLKYPEKLQALKGSGIYFDSMRDSILKHIEEHNNTIDIADVLAIIEKKTVRKKKQDADIAESGGLPPPTSNKLKNVFISLWKKKIFDMSTDLPSKLILKTNNREYRMNPFSACLAANLVPSLLTSQLQQEEYYENYFQNFLEEIYNGQTRPGTIFSDNQLKIWLFCDELNNIPKSDILKTIFRTGGPNRIGFVWSAQEPEDLDETIVKQTKYIIMFKPYEKDIKVIEKNYGLTKSQIKRIRNQEKFQCTLVAQEPVWIYDVKLNTLTKDTITEKPQFGGMIFPCAQPKAPSEMEDELVL